MKPVLAIGHGLRAAGADAAQLLELNIPIVSSWQAADLVDNWHPNYMGRIGIYGQRCANMVFYEADTIISLGCRLTPWMIGHAGLRPNQSLVMVDCDRDELARFPNATHVHMDVKKWLESGIAFKTTDTWINQCRDWRERWPWIESPLHDDTGGYMNSYRIIERIQADLLDDEIVTVDVGCVMVPVFQSLRVRPPQRLITSGGLGEMGCAIPAAIGASFARNNGEVLCLVGDGGAMINLQELQTIAFHRLPIKIIVFENDGYAMIKGTHKNIKMPYTGVDRESGTSLPDFTYIAEAFGIKTEEVHNWAQWDDIWPFIRRWKGPFLLVVHIDPEQVYAPRLQPIIHPDGRIEPAKFYDLSPQLNPTKV